MWFKLIVCLLVALPAYAQPAAATGVTDDGWSAVRKLAAGSEIEVTLEDSTRVERYLIVADNSQLILLNVNDPPLAGAAADVLRHVASDHPERFSAAEKGGTFILEKNVRLAG